VRVCEYVFECVFECVCVCVCVCVCKRVCVCVAVFPHMTKRSCLTLIVRTRVAYCSEFCVSSKLASVGDTFTNMSVLALPVCVCKRNIISER